jgi:uncharacterized membrane protein
MAAKKKSVVAKVGDAISGAASTVAEAAQANVIQPVGQALGLTDAAKPAKKKPAAKKKAARPAAPAARSAAVKVTTKPVAKAPAKPGAKKPAAGKSTPKGGAGKK